MSEREKSVWQVIRRSTSTGRTLKVLFEAETEHEARVWLSGFGQDQSSKHVNVVVSR